MDLNTRVLVVDDFMTMRRIIRNILKEIGFTDIHEAENGKDALLKLKKGGYGLVMSDWNMPEMTGLDLLVAVRSDESLKNIPFVMVTAGAKKENIIEAVKAGVSSYVVKPFTAATIAEKLKKVLG